MAHGGGQIDGVAETEFADGAGDIRNIDGRRRAGNGNAQDADVVLRTQRRTHPLGDFADRKAFRRAHVVGTSGNATVKDSKEPLHQVIGVQVAPLRRTVALDDDRFARETVADEVPDCVMSRLRYGPVKAKQRTIFASSPDSTHIRSASSLPLPYAVTGLHGASSPTGAVCGPYTAPELVSRIFFAPLDFAKSSTCRVPSTIVEVISSSAIVVTAAVAA